MANVASHPHLQFPFHPGAVNHSPSPLGFGFGLSSTPVMSGWQSPSAHAFPAIWSSTPGTHPPSMRTAKRKLESDDDAEGSHKHSRDEAMDRSPTPDRARRVVMKRPKITPTVPVINRTEQSDKVGGQAGSGQDSDVDVGVLLASLPQHSLLPLLMSLLTAQPSLKSTMLSLIPRPSLDTAHEAIAAASRKLREAHPWENTSSTAFGFGQSILQPGKSSMGRDYILGRVKSQIDEFISTLHSYLPYFSYVTTSSLSMPLSQGHPSHTHSHATALQLQHKDVKHPSETFLFLNTVMSQILSQPKFPREDLLDKLRPRLIQEWNAWIDRVDEVVNRQGGMFGQEAVRTWERGLDEFAQTEGLDWMREVRDHWVAKVGWLVGRQQMEEL